MAFLSPEEVIAVRIKNAKKFPIEGTTKSFLIVKMAGDRALEVTKITEKIGSGELEQKDLYLHFFQYACAEETGALFSIDDAKQLLGTLGVADLMKLAEIIQDTTKVPDAGKSTGSERA